MNVSGRLEAAKQLIDFVNKSPSAYHAVEECISLLKKSGFKELKEADPWAVKPSDKYYVTKNKSTIIAFAVGGQYKPGNGFTVIGAHTDSPCLKLKPVSRKVKSGYLQVGVQCYGGGIWNTWFDRDLTVAGRVIVKEEASLKHKLVHIKKPILRVPHLAIHLQREMNENFGPNKETHLQPILATSVEEELVNAVKTTACTDSHGPLKQCDKHASLLMKALCEELNVEPDQVVDLELVLADTQPATIGGVLDEFVLCPRLDNLFNVFTATKALCDTAVEDLASETNVRMICCFDNEEVGSMSAQGADSMILEHVMRRLSVGGQSSTCFEESIPKSIMVSADQAHAVHPNYASKHEDQHQPNLHGGIVVKINANQRYATTAITSAILRQVANKCNVPLQDFVVRNDSPCGSTIGPIMSARLGMATVDVGGPQLSMHSIREMCCTSSVQQAVDLYKELFRSYPSVYSSMDL